MSTVSTIPVASPIDNAITSLVPVKKSHPSLGDTLKKAAMKSLGGGVPGAAAMGIQVVSLMWLRTTVNYQYRYGTTTMQALKALYKEGGVPRFYKGMGAALIQAPMSRFFDTASLTGTMALLDEYEQTRNLPIPVKTAISSTVGALCRIGLMPVDTIKTTLQVEGNKGMPLLMTKVKQHGPSVLFNGALASAAATWVGAMPWATVYSALDANLPQQTDKPLRLLRAAFIGFWATAISDVCSNSIRVIKTTRQTTATNMSYVDCAKMVIQKDGVMGLMGRGLGTKIISNGIQGVAFTVCWRLGQDMWNDHMKKKEEEERLAKLQQALQ